MKAVVLAAGEGSRMRPLTYSRPKAMIPIANKPLLEHLILEASRSGIGEFILVTGYKENKIREYFGDGARWNVKIDYIIQEKPTGTSDAVKLTKGLAGNKFIVMNSDVMTSKDDIARLASCKETTMAVKEVKDTTGLGVIEYDGDRITAIYEKTKNPPSKLANTGFYFLTKDIFPVISQTPLSPRGEYELPLTLEHMIRQGKPVFYCELNYWLDVSYPWDLLSANEIILSRLDSYNKGNIENNVNIQGPCAIGQNTNIRSGSYIVGPVIIGDNCDIGPNCYIRSATSIGNHCHIGAAVEVKNSIIMSGTKIPHHNYVGDSIIGENCNLGSGTKVANLRLDNKEIRVKGINTGRRKLGVIMGDGVETGVNTSINPGAIIGDNVRIRPGTVISGIRDLLSRML